MQGEVIVLNGKSNSIRLGFVVLLLDFHVTHTWSWWRTVSIMLCRINLNTVRFSMVY